MEKCLEKVLKMDIVTDFKIPTITNTIHTKETIIKKPSGFISDGWGEQQLFNSFNRCSICERPVFSWT